MSLRLNMHMSSAVMMCNYFCNSSTISSKRCSSNRCNSAPAALKDAIQHLHAAHIAHHNSDTCCCLDYYPGMPRHACVTQKSNTKQRASWYICNNMHVCTPLHSLSRHDNTLKITTKYNTDANIYDKCYVKNCKSGFKDIHILIMQ